MNEEHHEAISALVDGELDGQAASHALDRLIADPSLRRAWHGYNLARDALRDAAVADVPPSLLAAVRRGLEAEPMPRPAVPARARGWRRPIGPLTGLALAASVAGLAIIGIRAVEPRASVPVQVAAGASAAADREASVGGAALVPTPVRADRATAASRDSTRMSWNAAGPRVTARLNHYLVNYNEHLASGMRGMMPYARLVAHDGRH